MCPGLHSSSGRGFQTFQYTMKHYKSVAVLAAARHGVDIMRLDRNTGGNGQCDCRPLGQWLRGGSNGDQPALLLPALNRRAAAPFRSAYARLRRGALRYNGQDAPCWPQEAGMPSHYPTDPFDPWTVFRWGSRGWWSTTGVPGIYVMAFNP